MTTISGETPRADHPVEPVPEYDRPPFLHRRGLLSVLVRGTVMLLALAATVAFAVALARVTLLPSPASRSIAHANLRPGASLRAYLDQPAVRAAVQQLGGNLLLGAPFGLLLPALFPQARSLLRVTGLTALIMVTVETAQALLVEGRAFDVDDILLNTTGALVTWLLIGHRLSRALHVRRTTPKEGRPWHRSDASVTDPAPTDPTPTPTPAAPDPAAPSPGT
ncbi:VanZ family protein [Kitasatospora sp. NPDC101801]|uniref:VanZ family protein n=1 Tax=Kitasatospora sp. NPDC101801 TaxID=3364103 RepID=UPI0038301D67